MKHQDANKIIESRYKRYALDAVNKCKKDVWEEFRFRVTHESCMSYGAHEDTIRDICRGIVKSLPNDERELLLVCSDYYFNGDKGTPQYDKLLLGALEEELFSRVCCIASEPDAQEIADLNRYFPKEIIKEVCRNASDGKLAPEATDKEEENA